jgi:aryl-alcohol dehydrogenase-like predicted oxidoreductase
MVRGGKDIVAIPGTRSSRHLEENVAAAALPLDAQTLQELSAVLRDDEIAGDRVCALDPDIQR